VVPVVEVGLGPDDLRVEEVEPRLEFMGEILADLDEERSCSDRFVIT
jgi:hypothetical protein